MITALLKPQHSLLKIWMSLLLAGFLIPAHAYEWSEHYAHDGVIQEEHGASTRFRCRSEIRLKWGPYSVLWARKYGSVHYPGVSVWVIQRKSRKFPEPVRFLNMTCNP